MDKSKLRLIAKIVFPILTISWMGLIFFFSSQTGSESGGLSGRFVTFFINLFYGDGFNKLPPGKQEVILNTWSLVIRKGAHFTIFGILGVLSFLSVLSFWKSDYSYLIGVGITFLYAIGDELHQTFVSGRAGVFTDVLIDTSGSIVFLLAIYIIVKLVNGHRLKNRAN